MTRFISSLRFQLVAIVLLSVVPAMGLILHSGFEERAKAALQAQESAKKLVELASAQRARIICEARRLLFTLSQSPHGYLTETPQCSDYFRELFASHPHYLNIGIAGADGRIVCGALPLDEKMGHRGLSWKWMSGGPLSPASGERVGVRGLSKRIFPHPNHSC